MTLALVLAVLIGVTLGLMGSGGSILTLPVLVYVVGVPAQSAVAMSLVIVGATAALGSCLLARRNSIDAPVASVFAGTGVVGAFFGARMTHAVTGDVLMLLFGLLMIAAGGRLLRRPTGPGPRRTRRLWRCAVGGIALGVLTGFLGVGGGFLIVPALLLFAGLDMRRAVPTSLAIIAFNAAGGLLGQWRAASIDWMLTAGFLAAAFGGMLAGTALTSRISPGTLQRGFAWAIFLMGLAVTARHAILVARVPGV